MHAGNLLRGVQCNPTLSWPIVKRWQWVGPDYQPTESSTIHTMNAKCFSVQISPYKIAITSTLSKLWSLLIVFILSSVYFVQG